MKKTLRRLCHYFRRRWPGKRVINFRGKGIVNLIDVGSAGSLPHPWCKNANKIRHLLKFEPRVKPTSNPSVVTVDIALWQTNCERDFYIYQQGSGSSLFLQNYEYVAENFEAFRARELEVMANSWFERAQLDRIERIRCRTLDSVLQELNHPFPYHFLKVDAQGAEYQILRGAERFLRQSCLGLHLELFVLPLYFIFSIGFSVCGEALAKHLDN